MKILVNAISAKRGGSLVYLKNLIPELAALDRKIEYEVIISPNAKARGFFAGHRNIHIVNAAGSGSSALQRLWFEQLRVPQLLRSENYSWYFQIDDSLPPFVYLTGTRTVAVFHASIQSLLPDELGDVPLKVFYWRLLKRLALKYATLPITVSNCAKGELSRGDKQIFKRLQVVYHGIDRDLFNAQFGEANNAPNNLPERYILSVSTRNPHKNYYRLVQAFVQLVQETDVPEHLVLIGSAVWKSEEKRIRQFAVDHGLRGRVHLLEPLENELLPDVYRQATAYVYPSLFDSFGLTPMEAMSCGTPCAVSQTSALPETCGDAAEYFDPLDVQDIVSALKTVICDEQRRAELVELGFKHVERFSWVDAAKRYYELLTVDNLPVWSV